jgi:ATP-dependent Lhr-like helicase
VSSKALARRHRMSIGTIAGDATVEVKWLRGGRLGTVEE